MGTILPRNQVKASLIYGLTKLYEGNAVPPEGKPKIKTYLDNIEDFTDFVIKHKRQPKGDEFKEILECKYGKSEDAQQQ